MMATTVLLLLIDDDDGGGGGGDDEDDNNNDEHKRAKRWTALLFSSCKPKPSELQLRKGALLRRTPRPCLAQAPLPLPISLASHQCRSSVLQEPFGRASSDAPISLAHQCRSSVLQEPFGRASSDAPISPPLKTSGAWPRCSRPAVWMMRHHP